MKQPQRGIYLFLLLLLVFLSGCKTEMMFSQQVSVLIRDPDTSSWKRPENDVVRLALSKGVSLSNWFGNYIDTPKFGSHFDDTHFRLIKSLGFTHVRLPVAFDLLFNEQDPATLDERYIGYVDRALEKLIANGLSVILEPLHGANDNWELRLASDKLFQIRVALFWQTLAIRYRYKFGADQLFFETFGEPNVSVGEVASIGWWPSVQKLFLEAIRLVDKNHFIIVAGGEYNKISGLKQLPVYSYDRLVYNFHFYDKLEFTHQGAPWAGTYFSNMAGVPYPSSPNAVDSLSKTSTDTGFRSFLREYGSQYWNQQKIDSIMKDISKWSSDKGIEFITCNEFGTYKISAPRSGRLLWLQDTRSALEHYQIGWTMWDFDEGFGMIEYSNGRKFPIVDKEIVRALGLILQ